MSSITPPNDSARYAPQADNKTADVKPVSAVAPARPVQQSENIPPLQERIETRQHSDRRRKERRRKERRGQARKVLLDTRGYRDRRTANRRRQDSQSENEKGTAPRVRGIDIEV